MDDTSAPKPARLSHTIDLFAFKVRHELGSNPAISSRVHQHIENGVQPGVQGSNTKSRTYQHHKHNAAVRFSAATLLFVREDTHVQQICVCVGRVMSGSAADRQALLDTHLIIWVVFEVSALDKESMKPCICHAIWHIV